MRGGIDRAAHVVASARKEGPTGFIDAGDSLFSSASLRPGQVPQEERKARAIAEAFTRMGILARGTGERDEARGSEFRQALGLPEVAPGQARVVSVGGIPVGVVNEKERGALVQGAADVRKKGAAFVLGLVDRSMEETLEMARAPVSGIDLLVPFHAPQELSGEESRWVRAGTPVAQVQSKGRSLLRVDLSFAKPGAPFEAVRGGAETEREAAALDERIALLNREVNTPGLNAELKALKQQKLEELFRRRDAFARAPAPKTEGANTFSVRFVALEPTTPGDQTVAKIVNAYDRDVGRLNLAWAREHGKDCPAPTPERPGFVGNEACRECHADAFPVWEASKHAHAYETLEEKGKQFHLDCVGCHVTGYEQPGGVCRLDKVKGREDVGCESCHGPGSRHQEDPDVTNIAKGDSEAMCVGCHDAENSPHFDYARYLPLVLGKGHGKK